MKNDTKETVKQENLQTKNLQYEKFFEKVIGYKEIKTELYRLGDCLKNQEKYSKLGVVAPQGLLLYGAPGLGKTLLAQCFIEMVGRKSFVCRKEKSNGQFMEELNKIFDDAIKNAPSIILLDDLDKYANVEINRRNADEFVAIQSLIDKCKGKDVFVVATINEIFGLPDSLIRAGRFDKTIEINSPKGQDAVEIVKYYLSQKSFVSQLGAQELGEILEGRSCADLESIINEAGIIAGWQNKEKIEKDDIIKACLRVMYSAPETFSKTNEGYKEQIAIHEAGHTIVSEILEPYSVNLVSVCSTTGSTCGITSSKQNTNYWHDINYMENRIRVLLAGRVATELKYGVVDVGASQDLERAFSIAERMVLSYGIDGFDKMLPHKPHSEPLLEKRENSCVKLINRYYEQVKSIIKYNMDFLDKIAQLLLEKETILKKDIQEIKKECEIDEFFHLNK